MINGNDIQIIHIIWEGSLSVPEALKKTGKVDYGVYQIYGTHETGGPDTLLYIGQADANPFSSRIGAHEEEWGRWNAQEIKVYLGRLAGNREPSDTDWGKEIDRAEAVLIWKIGVPYNSARIKSLKYRDQPILVVNHGHRHRLPEYISTITEFDNKQTLKKYGSFGESTRNPAPVTDTSAEKYG